MSLSKNRRCRAGSTAISQYAKIFHADRYLDPSSLPSEISAHTYMYLERVSFYTYSGVKKVWFKYLTRVSGRVQSISLAKSIKLSNQGSNQGHQFITTGESAREFSMRRSLDLVEYGAYTHANFLDPGRGPCKMYLVYRERSPFSCLEGWQNSKENRVPHHQRRLAIWRGYVDRRSQ